MSDAQFVQTSDPPDTRMARIPSRPSSIISSISSFSSAGTIPYMSCRSVEDMTLEKHYFNGNDKIRDKRILQLKVILQMLGARKQFS